MQFLDTYQEEPSYKLDSERFASRFGWHFEGMIKGGMDNAIRLLLVQTWLIDYRPYRWKQWQIRRGRKHGTDLRRVGFATESPNDILSHSIDLNWNLLGRSAFRLLFPIFGWTRRAASRSIHKYRWYFTENKVKFLICPIILWGANE